MVVALIIFALSYVGIASEKFPRQAVALFGAVTLIFIAFPLLAAAMAAFMDSITVILFLSALTVQIAKIIQVDSIPLVIAEVCAANTGGTVTLMAHRRAEFIESHMFQVQSVQGVLVKSFAVHASACDPGCLMNIAGGPHKIGSPIRALHLSQVLANNKG